MGCFSVSLKAKWQECAPPGFHHSRKAPGEMGNGLRFTMWDQLPSCREVTLQLDVVSSGFLSLVRVTE